MVRYSESKVWKVGIVCKIIKLTTAVINLRKVVKTRERCCVGLGIITII